VYQHLNTSIEDYKKISIVTEILIGKRNQSYNVKKKNWQSHLIELDKYYT